ncbi:MAG TPA: flagellar basal-body rod protein FlgF [Desulfopila sp.]|nr:flagellar basal-body rod protein FlgF [Desulfopila sp.]
MVSGKYSALSGAITREQNMANVSANLANVSTIGYKKARMSFEAMLRGERQTDETKGINYNRVRGNFTDFSQGPLKETANPFDLAINGNGFFKIRTPEGDLLTRKGNFVVGQDGRLLSENGMPVLGAGDGEIIIDRVDITKISIDADGFVYTVDENGETTTIAQLAVVDVTDRSLLRRQGETAFSQEPGALEIPAVDFSIAQGSLEVSNVNMTNEMTKMLYDNRLFQAYHNVLEGYSRLGEKLEELGTLA